MCSFDASTRGPGRPFQLQINTMQLNSYTSEVHNGQEVPLRGRMIMLLSTWEKDSFQGQIRTNAPSYDNQQTLDIVSGATNNHVVLMEQQIEKKMGLQE